MVDFLSPINLPVFTFASLPSAGKAENMIVCSDYPGFGYVILRSDGTAWSPLRSRRGLGHYRTSGATNNAYSIAGLATNVALTSLVMSANTISAAWFVPDIDGTIDSISTWILATASGSIITGIYSNSVSSTTLAYPGSLIASGTSQSTATGNAKTDSISASLLAGQLYWFVMATDSTATIRGIPAGGIAPISGPTGGVSGANAYPSHLRANRTYDGTLPATFPTGATYQTTPVPAIYYRWQ